MKKILVVVDDMLLNKTLCYNLTLAGHSADAALSAVSARGLFEKLEKLWDADGNFVDEHALTSNISHVRGKIETNGVQYIKTVYGMGYMWIGGDKYRS